MLQGIRHLLINQGQEENFPGEGLFCIHLLQGFLSLLAELLVLALGREEYTRIDGAHVETSLKMSGLECFSISHGHLWLSLLLLN